MSIEKIVQYIKNTPGNTNPNVIKSMVEAENRAVLFSEIQTLKNDGAISDHELRKIFSFEVPEDVKEEYPKEEEYGSEYYTGRKNLITGQEYVVELDWGTYNCICTEAEYQGFQVRFISNIPNLEEIFRVEEMPENGFVIGEMLLGSGESAYGVGLISFSKITNATIYLKAIKPIKPQYLPGKLVEKTNKRTLVNTVLSELIAEKFNVEGTAGFQPGSYNLEPGKRYLIEMENFQTESICKIGFTGEVMIAYIGNLAYLNSSFDDSGESFLIIDGVNYGGDFPIASGIFDKNSGHYAKIKTAEVEYDFNYPKFEGQIGYLEKNNKVIIDWDMQELGESYFNPSGDELSDAYRYFDYAIDVNKITAISCGVFGIEAPGNVDVQERTDSNGAVYYAIKVIDEEVPLLYVSEFGFNTYKWHSGEDSYGEYVDVPPGTYVVRGVDCYLRRVWYNEEKLHKIDRKFLPEGVGYDETKPAILIKSDGAIRGKEHVDINHGGMIYYVKALDQVIDPSIITGIKIDDIFGNKVVYDKSQLKIKEEQSNGIPYIAIYCDHYYAWIRILSQPTTFSGTLQEEGYTGNIRDITLSPGTYILLNNNDSYTVEEVYSGTETIHVPIKQEYIPVMDNVTLKGENGKLYKLYIDSTGALKTQEI